MKKRKSKFPIVSNKLAISRCFTIERDSLVNNPLKMGQAFTGLKKGPIGVKPTNVTVLDELLNSHELINIATLILHNDALPINRRLHRKFECVFKEEIAVGGGIPKCLAAKGIPSSQRR